jgi:hypothetical protein
VGHFLARKGLPCAREGQQSYQNNVSMSQKLNLRLLIESATTKKDVVVKCKKPHASAFLLQIKRKATLAGRAWPFLRDGFQTSLAQPPSPALVHRHAT